MYVESLALENYRNYAHLSVNLSPGINIFFGDNAQGKTNVLEALYMCATTKSHREMCIRDSNQTDDILQRIQSLSSFANKQTHIFTIKNDIHRSVFFIIGYCTCLLYTSRCV